MIKGHLYISYDSYGILHYPTILYFIVNTLHYMIILLLILHIVLQYALWISDAVLMTINGNYCT